MKLQRISVFVNADRYERLKDLALERERTVGSLLREAVRRFLEEEDEAASPRGWTAAPSGPRGYRWRDARGRAVKATHTRRKPKHK